MRRLPASIPFALLCAGLWSCAPLGRYADPALRESTHAYHSGRAHQLENRPDAARAAYLQALQVDPSHLDARNGLATLHAQNGELAEAIAIWRDLTARVPPGSGQAYLFSNLGRAYRLEGDLDAARAAFEQACLRDPLRANAWQMLGETLAALGQEQRSLRTLAQAAALRHHDVRADFAATGGNSDVAAIGKALATPLPRAEPGWPQSWLETGIDGMLTLRRQPGAEAAAAPLAARVEIRNGNGVTGMARALSRRIDEPGMQVTRLSNDPGFAVRHTRIEYAVPHLDAAQRLAQRLGDVQLRPVAEPMQADLRLVLGRDLARHGTALRLVPGVDRRLLQR